MHLGKLKINWRRAQGMPSLTTSPKIPKLKWVESMTVFYQKKMLHLHLADLPWRSWRGTTTYMTLRLLNWGENFHLSFIASRLILPHCMNQALLFRNREMSTLLFPKYLKLVATIKRVSHSYSVSMSSIATQFPV